MKNFMLTATALIFSVALFAQSAQKTTEPKAATHTLAQATTKPAEAKKEAATENKTPNKDENKTKEHHKKGTHHHKAKEASQK